MEVDSLISQASKVVELARDIEKYVDGLRGMLGSVAEVVGNPTVIKNVTMNGAGVRVEPNGRTYIQGNRPVKPLRAPSLRARRGELKKAIHRAIRRKPLTPGALVKRLRSQGFGGASAPKVFYSSVFQALTRDRDILKTGEGYQLKH